MDFLFYLLKTSALLLLFFLFYYFFLKQDTYHQFKRRYLLTALFISILLPLLKFTRTVALSSSNSISTSADINSTASSNISNQLVMKILTWQEVVFYVYLLVLTTLLIRLIYRYANLYLSISNKDHKVIDHCKVHIVDEQISAFSFFEHIIISKKDFESDESDMILTHEAQHIKNAHYIDILLMNLFCVAFWFHPIIWLYKKLAIQNLEHQADDHCLQQIDEKIKYQYLLVNSSLQRTDFQLIESNIFQPSIKQRIIMINKKNTRNIYALKSLILLPILAFLFMSFQTKVTYKQIPASQNSKQTKPSTDSQLSDSLKKNNRIIVKFTEEADKEYLDNVKNFLRSNYDIDIAYSNIQFDDNLLTGLEIAVESDDGFSGNIYSSKFSTNNGIYLFRDYREYVALPFGVGKLPLPEFSDPETEGDEDSINIRSQLIFSPSKKEYTNQQNVASNKTKIREPSKAFSQEKLSSVKRFIINGKSYSITDLKQRKVAFQKFEFLNEKTLSIKGDIVDKNGLEEFINDKFDGIKDKNVKDVQMIFFLKNQAPILVNIDKAEIIEDRE